MALDVRDLTPAQWAFVVVLLLLAMAGLYYVYTLCCGYRCLPLKTTDCPGGKPHHLVYVNDEELGVLAKIAKHEGRVGNDTNGHNGNVRTRCRGVWGRSVACTSSPVWGSGSGHRVQCRAHEAVRPARARAGGAVSGHITCSEAGPVAWRGGGLLICAL